MFILILEKTTGIFFNFEVKKLKNNQTIDLFRIVIYVQMIVFYMFK